MRLRTLMGALATAGMCLRFLPATPARRRAIRVAEIPTRTIAASEGDLL
jgi:hypothetical protein